MLFIPKVVIHAPQTPKRWGEPVTDKINILHSKFHILAIGTFHGPYKHPYVKGYLSKCWKSWEPGRSILGMVSVWVKRTPSTTNFWILRFIWGWHCTSLKKIAVKYSQFFQLAELGTWGPWNLGTFPWKLPPSLKIPFQNLSFAELWPKSINIFCYILLFQHFLFR